jgi:anti-sigma B factor antagonist
MTIVTPTPNRRFRRLDSAALTGAYRQADPNAVVFMAGDLDMASREHWFDVCVAAPGRQVVVDLTATTFMDCSGYSALTAARRIIEGRGGTLTWQGANGEPARLLTLLGSAHAHVRGSNGAGVA